MIYRSGTVRGREAIAFWPDHREDLREDLDPARLPDSALATRTRPADGMTLADVQDLIPLTQWQGELRSVERFFQAAERCARAGWCVVLKLDALYVRDDGSPCFIALPYSEPSVGSAEAVRRYLRDPNDFDSFLPHCPLEGMDEDRQDADFFRQVRGDVGEAHPFFDRDVTDEAIDMFTPEPQVPAEEAPPAAPTDLGPVPQEVGEAPVGGFGGLVEETTEEDRTPGFFQPQSRPEPLMPQDREAARNKVATAFEQFSEALQTFLQSDATEASGHEGSDFAFKTTSQEAAPQPEPPAAPAAEAPVTPEPEPPAEPMAGEDPDGASMDFSAMFSGFDPEPAAEPAEEPAVEPAAENVPEPPARKAAFEPQDDAGSFNDVMSFFEDLMKQNEEP